MCVLICQTVQQVQTAPSFKHYNQTSHLVANVSTVYEHWQHQNCGLHVTVNMAYVRLLT